MGKAKLETFRNPTHFLILTHLAEKPNNAYGLSLLNTFTKSQSVAYRELIELEKENYVILEDTGKNVYNINYEKIFEEFYNFVLEFINESIEKLNLANTNFLNEELDENFYLKYKTNSKIKLISDLEFIKNLKINKYVKILLLKYLKFYQSKSYISTLEQAFQRLVTRDLMLYNGELEYDFFENKLGFNNEVLVKKDSGNDYVNTFTLNENQAKIKIYEKNFEFNEFIFLFNFLSCLSLEFITPYMNEVYDEFLLIDNVKPYIKDKHKPYVQD